MSDMLTNGQSVDSLASSIGSIQSGYCSTTWPTSYQWPTYWPTYTQPSVAAFKGAIKSLDKLPKGRPHTNGDAYYVEDIAALVVRHTGGWFHFDKS